MPILDLAGAKPLFPKPPAAKRTMTPQNTAAILAGGTGRGGFAAAKLNRLTLDFLAGSRSADQDLFGDNIRLRARARSLALDNPFARKFLAMLAQNVIGPDGILLQAKVTSQNDKQTASAKAINKKIEQAWNDWCRPGSCTADGRLSLVDVCHLSIKNCGREGENLVKFVYDRSFNEVGFALQLLDNDQLDDTLLETVSGNAQIRMGVEVDQYRRPLAYHLWNGHPNDIMPGNRLRTRVPADQVVHTAIWERPGQSRGYTWMAPAILAMNQYGRYEEAVIVASRASAAKFLVIQQQMAEGYSPDDEDEAGNDRNMDGTAVMTGNAGEVLTLEPGETANFIDPRFPTTTHEEFTRTILRNIGSGLLVSYPSLANDLSGINFSSIRAGLLDERDSWRLIQRWFIDNFLQPIFQAWLRMALLTVLSDITLTPEQTRQISWKARGWEWVDPQKDANATVLKLGNGLTTYAQALAALGLDFEETMQERSREQKFIDSLGLKMGTDLTGDQSGKGVAAENEASTPPQGGEQGGNQQGKQGGKSK